MDKTTFYYMVQEQQLDQNVATATPANMYELNSETIRVNVTMGASKTPFTHILRKPTFEEAEARERKTPLITSDRGKVDGQEASSMSMDDEPGNVYLYDKVIQAVSGYAINPGEKPSKEEIPADKVIKVGNEDKTVRELIPDSHKSTAINGMFPSKFVVEGEDDEDCEFTFALGGGREWRITQSIGGRKKQDDGTLSKPDYSVVYTFREPSESERKKFRTDAIIALNLRDPKTNTFKERRSTNLKVINSLFDALISGIEGACVDGSDVKVGTKEHLSLIPSDFKKGSIVRLFNFLEADLGN